MGAALPLVTRYLSLRQVDLHTPPPIRTVCSWTASRTEPQTDGTVALSFALARSLSRTAFSLSTIAAAASSSTMRRAF